MRVDQLGLLLWKNYIVRKRQPGILALVFIWPVVVFMILYTIRDNVEPEYNPTCQFSARSMPQDGLLPFVQSFICSMGNPCDPLSEYEEVPSYKNATLGRLVVDLQPMLNNETILSAVKTLPNSIQLLKSMVQILTRPEIKALFDRGIRLGDLFENHEEIKDFLRLQMPNARKGLFDDLFESSIKLLYLIETFGSSNIDGVICSPEMLKKYLILPKEEDFTVISKILCDIDSQKIPDILDHIMKHFDFNGLLEMVNRVMAKFRNYDFFQDLRKAVETILDLKTSQKLIPEYLRLRQWMPKIITVFKNVTFKEIDLTFVNKSLEVLNPVFASEPDWQIFRRSFIRLNKLLELVKGMIHDRGTNSAEDFSTIIKDLRNTIHFFSEGYNNYENLTQILDLTFAILLDGAKLTDKLLDRHADEIQLTTEIFDGLRNFLSDNIMNSLSYIVSLMESVVEMIYHVAITHEDTMNRIYKISKDHQHFIQKILTDLNPNVYRVLVASFSRLDVVEKFVENAKHVQPEELFCSNATLNAIFDNFKDTGDDANKIEDLLCSDDGKKFISNIYNSFEFDKFEKIISNSLSTVIDMAFNQVVKVEDANLTSTIRSIKGLVTYLESPRPADPDWTIFAVSDSWKKAFEDTRPQGRLDILGIHLSIAKLIGSHSISYLSIKPDLENMDMLADVILQDLQANPTIWISEVRRHKMQLIESFYLTITDREKVLKILEFANFTRTYCTNPNPPSLLNFPKGTNETILKSLVCRLSKSVQMSLELNVTDIQFEQTHYRDRRSFNWTAFNEKAIKIYRYIDTLVYHEETKYNFTRLEELKKDFKTSWTKKLTWKEGWETSVGLICKLFTVMESSLFNIQARKDWKNMGAIAWASSVIFDYIEVKIDQIQRNDYTTKLPELLQNMPQTEMLLKAVLGNLSPLILDIVDIMTLKSIHFIFEIDDYMMRESRWPCVLNESIGAAMQFRRGSLDIVQEIERIACQPADFVQEWKDQPIIMKARKILQHDNTVQLPPFNWTLGYVKLRRLTDKLDHLLDNAKKIALQEQPNLFEHLEDLVPEVQSIFDDRWPHMKDDSQNDLVFIDLVLDKSVKPFHSNRSASGIWKPWVTMEDRILVSVKFIAHVVHKVAKIVTNVLHNGNGQISLLSLLGFSSNTPVALFYDKLPYLVAMLANGLSDSTIDNHIIESLENNSTVTCSEIFQWWSDSVLGITKKEYRILKNFTCDFDPENFNAYTDLYMEEMTIWTKPVSDYQSFVAASIGDMYDLAKVIKDTREKDIVIEMPFSGKYGRNFLQRLRDTLSTRNESTITYKELGPDSKWMRYRRFMDEGISEGMLHVAEALNKIDVKNNTIHIWDLVQSSDMRQLLKILENHPEETIALVASITNLGVYYFISFENVRKYACDYRFGSDYWTTPNRTRFLKEICSFDPHQLMMSITSEKYFLSTQTGPTVAIPKSTPLSLSLTKLTDAILNLTSTTPDLTLHSNIFNWTTWKHLSNDTKSLISDVQLTQIHNLLSLNANIGSRSSKLDTSSDFLSRMIDFSNLLNSLSELLSGGDIWQKLRVIYESSKVKPILTLVEDMPNLVLSAVDTFVTSERLSDFAEKLLLGRVHPCDIDKYLIVPAFVRKKIVLSSITNFCQKILTNEKPLDWMDVLPLDGKYEENRTTRNYSLEFNETYLLEKINRLQSTLIRVGSEGFKEPKVPTWWTSFREGTFQDFLSRYRKKDMGALAHSMVKKLAAIAKDVLNSDQDSKSCSWCSTFPIEILNSQLVYHNLYSKLLCQINRLNASEIHDILIRDFYWNKTASMVKNYRYLNKKRTVNEFVTTLEGTLHYVVDIIINFQNETYSNRVNQCFHKFVGTPSYSRPGLYISFLLGILDVLQKNVYILDSATNHKNIGSLTRIAENYVPIWKPLRDVVKKSDIDDIDSFLPNATINVNAILNDRNNSLCRTKVECQNSTILYNYLSSRRIGKVFRYDQKASGYPSMLDISIRLSRSLDLQRIDSELSNWRMDAAWDLTWLKEILRHLSVVIGESGNLLDVASKIDFQDVSNVLGVPDLADGVVNILKDKTVDKLFTGIKDVLEDTKPFIQNQEVIDDLYSMIVALESMDIFKNLGLLDMKYVIGDMFTNWDTVRSYIVDKIGISNDVASTLSQAKVDMFSVFMKERRALSLKDTICSPEKLGDMLSFNNNRINAEEVSSVICQLDDKQTQNVTITLMRNLNFDYIFKTLLSANVKNILTNANLTEAEEKLVLDNLGVAAELLPFFRDRLSSGLPSTETQEEEEDKTEEKISTSKFLQDSSLMLCGQAMTSDNDELYKIISKIEDNSKEVDKRELDTLPTDFCRDTYKGVIAMPGGKIVWSYIKPLLRGQILYAPNTTAITEVMRLANHTFMEMENFGDLMNSFEQTLNALANLSEMGDSLKELQNLMSSDVMKIAIKFLGNDKFQGDFSDMNLSEVAWRLKRSKKLITMVGMLNDLMDCVLVDRVKGFSTEEEVEIEARSLMETREFLAGVIFLNDVSQRSKRSLEKELPNDVIYKIRMDVDYVPSTKRLKNQFWIPGPESSFIEHLRYLRGFIQLQDSIDRAIIKSKSQKDQEWKTMTQQMPYPCWKYAPFQTTLYESQGVQVCFFFALMMCVGSAVRHIVWERESQNSMVMSVMGLKPWRNTLAWFITTFVELLIVLFSISLILLVGKILPRSDPSLILIMLMDYAFAIVTFCYMISTICSSASLAAITTVVMFLLTFMPYIIVIAMEAAMSLGYKLLICLSMSTSFCYGCLYAVRKEVQGVGLTWDAMWEESSPGDSMSLGLVLLAIAFDGCLYAMIGYLIARYTNSGRGFPGLRSRSLWWADTRSLYGRPSYLTFVNNLYFTNDVLHPSATYQDEDSDISNLTVSEKQTGVKFEAVRKVYNGEQGEVVAVDDFTLKLCEGEVTSLLGRNGAGKTTIIKMLTGMLAPTSGEICLNGEEGCKPDIGVCPQDNVLIGTLTPREHMIFYAMLKSPKDGVNMQKSVDDMLTSLELGRQEHEPVCRLSGGTRRRLCVALAFLGSPKLVILDEPGAGVDPAARRRIWRLIDRHRIGRTVILSTHHLDEADMLSDTVVVMHRGRILCTGSPLSLKMTHGRGYRLHVSYPVDHENNKDSMDKKKLETLRTVIEEVVPNAVTNETSSSEVIVTLPFQGKNGINNDIAQAAKVLEDSQKLLGYSHFSLECDTLERVFLDVCSRAESGSSIIRASQDSVISVDHVGSTIPNDEMDLIDAEHNLNPSPIRQIKALLKKRIWHFRRDWLTLLAGLLLPTMFVAVAMGFSLIRPPSVDEPPLVLTPNLYDTHPTYFYSIDNSNDPFLQHVSLQLHERFGDDYAGAWQAMPNDTGTCECVDGQQTCRDLSQAVEGLLQILPGRHTLDWIVSTHQEYIEKRYGGWSLSHTNEDPLFIVWYNNKGHHALPSYLNALNEAILRASGVQGHLTTLNHPLKLSSDQLNRTSLLQHVADVGVALVLLIAFNLVAAQGSKELVRERLSEEKRILYLAGVHPLTYWTTALIWDYLVFACSVGLAVIVFEIFGLPAYVARDNLAGVCLLLFLFAWAVLPFCHLVEKIFDDSSLSNMVLFCVNTFIGVASLATILVLDILGKTKTAEDTRNILHHILLIFPQYALGDALVQISRNDITAELLEKFNMDTYKSPLRWELLGVHYVILTIVGGVLFVLNLLIECRVLPTFSRQRCPYEVSQEDDDVARERLRVEGGISEDTLQTVKLRKEYRSVYGTNVALQNLSIGVQSGKCFGLLGTNGAGKSTTFKMLTTEIIPTAGRIILKGKEIGSRPLCNGEVGYCPQSDALDGFLTPHQCLTIHGEVCGLSNVPKVVETMLKRLDLLKYAHRRASSLSGGNKRKLCTAMSVMSPVSVVLMDEPTSGMDPATKDLVARVIKLVTRNQGCVILTSHSVAECENLCDRVGILARAGLRCIGTPQHLKHKFGEGYVAFLRFRHPVSSVDLRKAIAKYLPQAVVSSRQATAARILIPRSQDTVLSTNFNKVRLIAEELKAADYTLTQSSLDQVLVNFSEEMDDEIDASNCNLDGRNNLANVYTSMDTIHMETF